MSVIPSPPPYKLFIIYSREDQTSLKDFKSHLRPLERSGDLKVWFDGEIVAGQYWEKEVKENLRIANIIVLFITKNFFDSDYIENEELQEALKRHNKKETIVIPVIVSPCVWDANASIKELQVLPKDGKPVLTWSIADEAWADVTRGIRKIAEKYKIKYEDYLAKEEVKRAVELYNDQKFEDSFSILNKFKDRPGTMTPLAHLTLGEIYLYGEGGAKQNYLEALTCFLEAGRKGIKEAQIHVGIMFENGQGVPQNIDEAISWYKKAEKGGNHKAQFHLGSIYEEYDLEVAIFWYKKSASQGNWDAKKSLKSLGHLD